MSKGLLVLIWVIGIFVGLTALAALIKAIWNHFRGKHPVDYGYTLESVKVLLGFESFKSLYLAAPECFSLRDEYVFFYNKRPMGVSYSFHIDFSDKTCIGFRTLNDLWDYKEWKEKIDNKKKEAENDAAALEFCQKMNRILEEKKRFELEKTQTESQKMQSTLETMAKINQIQDEAMRSLPPTTDSILRW